jgi:carboxymethylenebutenolidase
MGTMVEAKAADGHELGVYRAEPAGQVRGGLVVAQEIFGVNSHIREVCDGYAADGYLAVAPALFDRVERGVELGYQSEDIARGRELRQPIGLEQAMMDMEAAAALVAGAGRIGAIGYCWGGSIAWVAATRSKTFAATVGYYGGMVPDLAGEQPNCPVQLHFGEQDQSIPLAGVEAFKAAQPEVPVFIYPAGHGFSCDHRGSYHAESARLARERALALLRQHVG